MSVNDMGYEIALEEIELQFGTSEVGDVLPPIEYKANLIDFIQVDLKRDIDEIWKKGIFDLEDIVLDNWAENRMERI
jgi:hypothetical protein|tara:strand:- start:645 stop:875 length:231 start_codon:yes stop_codon:yes gene_type:complete